MLRKKLWKKEILLLLLVIVAAFSVMAMPGKAMAQDWAHYKCQNGYPGDFNSGIYIPGNTFLQQEPIIGFRPGDVIRIVAWGTINTGGWSGSHGPDGNNTITWGGQWPFQGGRAYSLYGYWGQNGFEFRVGSDSGCFDFTALGTGPGPATLLVGVNDENIWDNTGGFNTRIMLYRN